MSSEKGEDLIIQPEPIKNMKESLLLKEILCKREEYAVSLRRKKRQQRVNFKRKLNEDSIIQNKSALDNFDDDYY